MEASSKLCADHKLPLKLFCEDCEYLICNKCNRQYHSGHEVVAPSIQQRNEALLAMDMPTSKDEMKEMLETLREAAKQETERSTKLKQKIEKRRAELAQLKNSNN